jgi:electron transfer flavoprotein beta subunit
VRIVVLTKPVPDPAAGAERLGPDHRLDRAASPTVINGNDEYALEAALQLVEAHGGEVVVLTMTPANGTETIRKALAMGAQRGILVTDEALAGADLPTTIRVLAAAVTSEPFDLLLGGLDTSDGAGGAVTAGVAARLGLPLLSAAGKIEPDLQAGRVRVHRLSAKGYDLVEAPMPAVISCTQALGAPRYPSLKGIMAARSREIAIRSLPDLGPDLAPDGGGWATTVLAVDLPPARAAGRVISGGAPDMAREIADLFAARRII